MFRNLTTYIIRKLCLYPLRNEFDNGRKLAHGDDGPKWLQPLEDGRRRTDRLILLAQCDVRMQQRQATKQLPHLHSPTIEHDLNGRIKLQLYTTTFVVEHLWCLSEAGWSSRRRRFTRVLNLLAEL